MLLTWLLLLNNIKSVLLTWLLLLNNIKSVLLTWLSALMLSLICMRGPCRTGIESEELRGRHRVVHPVYGIYEGSWTNGLCHDKGRWVPVAAPLNLNPKPQTLNPKP